MKPDKLLTMSLMLMSLMLVNNVHCIAQPEGLILWNKLGNDTEIANSEAGPNMVKGGSPAPTFEPGKFGNAVMFNHWSQYVTAPNLWGTDKKWGQDEFTFEFWCKINSWGWLGFFFDFLRGTTTNNTFLRLYMDHTNSGKLHLNGVCELEGGSDLVTLPNGYDFGNWHHYAIVVTTSHVQMYYDGVLLTSRPIKSGELGKNMPYKLDLGAEFQHTHSDFHFYGTIDNVKVYEYAKTNFDDRFIEDFPKLILWNKMGSAVEITGSEVGSNLNITGSPDYLEARFGNGLRIDAQTETVTMPATAFPATLGDKSYTVEFWYKPTYPCADSRVTPTRLTLFGPYQASPNTPYTNTGITYAVWGKNYPSVTDLQFASSCSAWGAAIPPLSDYQLVHHANWLADELVHLAFVFDAARTDNKSFRVYVNGTEHVYATTVIPAFYPTRQDDKLFLLGRDRAISGRYANGLLDNLKIYNYAKTDFSDRFNEGINDISISISSPTSGTIFNEGENMTITAATSGVDAGKVTNVEFYANGTLVGSDNVAPYEFVLNNIIPGVHTLSIKAMDSDGSVIVNPSDVEITVNATPRLLLWNKMGSDFEVANSEIGSAFAQVGTVGYSDAKFDKGHNDNGSAANYLEFGDPNVITKRDAWTIEFWAKYDQGLTVTNGVPQEWSQPHILTSSDNGTHGTGEVIGFLHRSPPSFTYFQISDGINAIWTNNTTCNIATNDLVHWALVYDVNGIDGSADKIRLYYYNETSGQATMNSASGTFNGFTKDWFNIRFGRAIGQSDNWRPHMTIDNIKVYNYAKTNFEDRFIEGLPIEKTITLQNSQGDGLPGGTVKYYAGGWNEVAGETGADGNLKVYLPETTIPTKWKMYYAGASMQKDNIEGPIIFQTVNVTMNLNSSGTSGPVEDLISDDAKYYASGWKTFGTGETSTSMELLPNNYKFKVYYKGGSMQKSQEVGVDPNVVFETVQVTMDLKSSDGMDLLPSDDAKYYASGWKQFGNGITSTSMELLPNNYKFKVYYLGGSKQKTQDIGTDPNVIFNTELVTMNLFSSTGATLNSDDAKYYAGGWKQFDTGITPASIELLPNNYKFKIYYQGGSKQKSQDIGTDPNVIFETDLVTMNLVSSTGATLNSDDAKYYAGGWKQFDTGVTPASIELLPNNYKFKVYYQGGSKQKTQDIGTDPDVVFETGLVTMNLFSSGGASLMSDDAKYYASGWKTFGSGNTSTSMELLPNNYKFKVYYAGGTNQKSQSVLDGSVVDFATINVTMTLEVDGIPQASTDAKCYASGWKTFGTGITETSMELLPNTYKFKVYFDGTSEQKSQDISTNPLVEFGVSTSGARLANLRKETEIMEEISIYPNPVRDMVFLEYPIERLDRNSEMKIDFYSITGSRIGRIAPCVLKQGRLEIDVSQLPTGMYILSIPVLDNLKYKLTKL
jgi:hypothetical protein